MLVEKSQMICLLQKNNNSVPNLKQDEIEIVTYIGGSVLQKIRKNVGY